MEPHPKRRSVDGFLPPSTKPADKLRVPPRSTHAMQPRGAQWVPRKRQPPQPTRLKRPFAAKLSKVMRALLQTLLFLFLFGLGFFVQTLVVGQVAIAVYAVAAFCLRIPSRTTFLLAILAFVIVLAAQTRNQSQLASVFAIYAFLLLVIGAATLALELRDDI